MDFMTQSALSFCYLHPLRYKVLAKAIKSAAANAEHNFNLNRDDLVLKQLLIDEGPTYKRRRPVSRSMAHEFFHRTCHITAVVEDRPKGDSN